MNHQNKFSNKTNQKSLLATIQTKLLNYDIFIKNLMAQIYMLGSNSFQINFVSLHFKMHQT